MYKNLSHNNETTFIRLRNFVEISQDEIKSNF